MKLSKFFHKIYLDNDVYAIYNSLVMDIIYVTKSDLKRILNFDVSETEKTEFKNAGIYISNYKHDEQALNVVKDRYNLVTGKVQIMYLVLSSGCNLACKYCFIENCSYNNKKELNMSLDIAKTAVKKYTDYLEKEKLKEGLIILYGGEPMVNWEAITTVVEYAKEINSPLKFSMVTNATLLNTEKIKYLAENNVELGISIDGPKSLNDKNRIYRNGSKSVYDEVTKKFPELKFNKAKFGLSITVSEDFLKQQDEVLQWLKTTGVNNVFYNLYHYTNYVDNWEEYYKEASKFLLKSYETLSCCNINDGRLNRKIDSVLKSEFKFADCGAIGANQLAIKPNGDICICHGYLKTDKYVIGNIITNSIEKIMQSEEIAFWKQRSTLNNLKCLKCDSLFACGGGCAIQAEALFGSRSKIDKPFCIHTKTALKWVLKKGYEETLKAKIKQKVNL